MTYNFKKVSSLSKRLLLFYNTQETYLEHYLGIPVKKGIFKNPMRADSKPTCSFYKNKAGDVIFNDFSGFFSGNFISVVMFLYNCNFKKALAIIANDFNITESKSLTKNKAKIEYTKGVLEEKEEVRLQAQIQDFTEEDLKWWGSFGITKETLEGYNVYSIKHVFINGIMSSTYSKSCPIYGYFGGVVDGIERWKFYFPKRSSFRFLNNWTKSIIQGFQKITKPGKFIIITKSLKDVMLLHEFGIPALAPSSESTFLTKSQYENLLKNYENIYLLYDNDLPGISSMNKIRKAHPLVKVLFLPKKTKCKDISDFYKKFGRSATQKLIDTVYAKEFKR